MDDETDERIRQLEERLARIEARLGLGDTAGDVIGNLVARRRNAREAREPPEAREVVEATPYPVAPPPLPAGADASPPPIQVAPRSAPPPPPAAVVGYAPPAARRPVPQGDLERAIGLKWAGWFGAAVLVVGVALGIKFAYDQGWLGGMPDVAKLLLMSLGGFGLIAAGEVVLRRVNRLSAAGPFGAGVAVLFLVGYAGHAWYNVYAQNTAFALMGLATVVGVLVAARADLVSVAVLSLLGGHAAPVLLNARAESVVPFLSYLLLLQALALALCYWRATPKWWTLRSLSLVATSAWQLAIVSDRVGTGAPVPAALAVFSVVYALAYHAELVLTTLRTARPPAGDAQAARRPVPPGAGVAFSVFVTASFVLTALLSNAGATAGVRGAWVLSTAAACAAGAVAMRASRRRPLAGLSASLGGQAAALLALAVPVLLDGSSIVFGWLALAVAFAVVGELARLRLASAAAVLTWALAVVALNLWATSDAAAKHAWLVVAEAAFPAGWFVALAVAVCGHVVAALLDRVLATPAAAPARVDLRPVVSVVHAAAAVVLAAATVLALPPLAGTAALLVYAWLLCAASYVPLTRKLAFLSAAVVLAVGAKWAVVDLLRDRLDAAGVGPRPILNARMLAGGAIAATLAAVGWTRRGVLLGPAVADRQRLFQSVLVLLSTLVLVVGLSAEVAAIVDAGGPGAYAPIVAKQLTWTMLWVVAAAGVLLVDRLVLRPAEVTVARTMVVAIVALAGKYLLVDAIVGRLEFGAAAVPVLANLPTLAAGVVWGGLAAAAYLSPDAGGRSAARVLAAVILLVLGSIEVDRFAVHGSAGPEWIVRQAGWSVWWSAFAVGSVVVGFAAHVGGLRKFGLAVFGLTLVKVVLVDLSGAGTGWRILSFVGLGGLLLGTSVLYGRFGPRGEEERTE